MIRNYLARHPTLKRRLRKFRKQEIIPESPRFNDRPLVYYETEQGNYYLPADAVNDLIANAMRRGALFEPEIIETAHEYIQEGSMVLDVGANFGQMSILFSRRVGSSGRVLSFEADDYIHYILQKNLGANQCYNVKAYCGAVGKHSGETKFYPRQDFKRFSTYGSYGISPQALEGRIVQSLAIDDLHIKMPISLLKIDIQGSDLFALQGAVNTINIHQMPIIIEFEQRFQDEFGTTFQDYIDFFHDISYKIVKTVYDINFVLIPKEGRTIFDFTQQKHVTRSISELPLAKFMPSRKQNSIFLQTQQEVNICTEYLIYNGYVSHLAECKNWDLAHLLPQINDGNCLDMGSSDSFILKNLVLKGIDGELHGIDLRPPNIPLPEVKYAVGDLLNTGLPADYFRHVTCLSVIEHGVDFPQLSTEVARLLEPEGRLYVTFDYWEPRIVPAIDLFGLPWQPLDRSLAEELIECCASKGLELLEPIDWSIGNAVINPEYYSPNELSYTFGLFVFQKITRAMNG